MNTDEARKQYLEHLAAQTDEALAADATWDNDSFLELHRRYAHLLAAYLLKRAGDDVAFRAAAVAWAQVRRGMKFDRIGARLRPRLFSIAANATIELKREKSA